jgi:hypothetical protein
METGYVIFTVVLMLFSILAGFKIGYEAASKRVSKGTVYVTRASAEIPASLYLESDVPVEVIASDRYITFEVRKTR